MRDSSSEGFMDLGRDAAPLVPCSALACALLAGRWLVLGDTTFAFLLWNLFLAWLPLGFALLARRLRSSASQLFVLGLWLIFFPNAPYIVSDLMHLRERGAPLWFDAALLATFALAGLFVAVASLRVVHELVAARAGYPAAWGMTAAVCGLSGFGIYLGRFLRLNSWDALLHPLHLAHLTAARLSEPLAHPQTWGVSAVFAALLFATYIALEGRPGRREPGSSTALCPAQLKLPDAGNAP